MEAIDTVGVMVGDKFPQIERLSFTFYLPVPPRFIVVLHFSRGEGMGA